MTESVFQGTQVNQSVVRLIKGDVTELEVDAFVYYAQHDLALGSGFGGAIAVRGGASIQKELDELGPQEAGAAVVTAAGNMTSDFIVHAVGPRFREDGIDEKLRVTMDNVLQRAEEKGITTIAFPLMGAGYYGVPNDVSARVMVAAIKSHLEGETGIKEITVCVFDTPQYESVQATLAALG